MSPLTLALGALLALAAPAAAQTVINSVPYTIAAPGKYVLGGNVITPSAASDGITVNASNVILDLNGFFVSGPGNFTSSTAASIFVGNVSNVTIRNGTVANNGYGILFNGGANSINHVVDGINVTRCYLAGISLPATAGSLVRRCRLSQIGGSTVSASGPDVHGILATTGVRIEKCSVTGLTAATSGGGTFGIRTNTGCFVIGNTVSGCLFGIQGGKYQNNLTFNCTTPFNSGTNAGGNN